MFTLTTVVNLLAMSTSLWLGFFILTRRPRSRVSWLAAATLWSVASLELHNVVTINVPQRGLFVRMRPLVMFAFPSWFHLTFLLVPDAARWWRRRVGPTTVRAAILLAYGVAFAIVFSGVVPARIPPDAQVGTMAYLSGRESSTLYPVVALYLVLVGSLSLFNLWRGLKQTGDTRLSRTVTLLLAATVLALLGGLYISLGVTLRLDFPTYPGDVLIGAGVILLGYSVARHNALIEVRTVQRDFSYSLMAIGLLAAFYYLVTLVLYFGGEVSFLSLMLVIVVAISSHALYDGVRVGLDRLFFREQFRSLRANLRVLSQDAGTGQTLTEQLQAILESLCRTMRIREGFIALQTEDGFVAKARRGIRVDHQVIPLSSLTANQIVGLTAPLSQVPREMTLLVPLCAGGAQIGALVLGRRESHQPYREEDLELLLDLSDQIATVIHTSRLHEENARVIDEMVSDLRARERTLQQVQQLLAQSEEESQAVQEGVDEKGFTSAVEEGLRRLYDYPYLGKHRLAQLHVVTWHLENNSDGFVTHIDRGKALNEILLQALQKLRPEGAEPSHHEVPRREWHQFIILHDAYVLGENNRDIMSRLYISAGTFNRARRRAIRGVARAVREMEREVQKQTA